MNANRIDLRIDALVLDGFETADGLRIAAAVERELVRLLGARGMPAGFDPGRVPARIDAGTVDLKPGSRPEAIGTEVATALYQGMRS